MNMCKYINPFLHTNLLIIKRQMTEMLSSKNNRAHTPAALDTPFPYPSPFPWIIF